MTELEAIILHLKQNSDADAVFLTDSFGKGETKPHSDIDLVIVLKENPLGLYSYYRWIDGMFADIFFFDLADLARMRTDTGDDTNGMDCLFLDWLKSADVQFDKSGTLTALRTAKAHASFAVAANEKLSFWEKINYNLVANKRYFESGDPLYHQALEMRLLYGVMELICGYLALRDIPWRGEKDAVRYLSEHAQDFYALFQKYSAATSLVDRFAYYSAMADKVFTEKYRKWSATDAVLLKRGSLVVKDGDPAVLYVKELFKI